MENTRTQRALIFRNFLEPLFNSQFNMFKKQKIIYNFLRPLSVNDLTRYNLG